MKKISSRSFVAVALAAGLVVAIGSLAARSYAAQEGSYTCKNGTATRKIYVKYSQAGKPTPCEVIYVKEGSDQGQTKWSAQAVEGYCEQKAREFSEKLNGMGWKCSGGEEAPAAAAAAPAAGEAKK